MKAGNLVIYTEDIHCDIGIVIKIYSRKHPDRMSAMIQWIDDLSIDYFNEWDWGLLEVISGDK